jgi:hypothetical protein
MTKCCFCPANLTFAYVDIDMTKTSTQAKTKSKGLTQARAIARVETQAKAHLTAGDFTVLLDWIADPARSRQLRPHSRTGWKDQDRWKGDDQDGCLRADGGQPFLEVVEQVATAPDGAQMQSRWRTQLARYRQTREAAHQRTGFGLYEDEIAEKMTLKAKLNEMCSEYERMEELFGKRPNIQPVSTLELVLPPEVQLQGDRDRCSVEYESRADEQRDEASDSKGTQDLRHCKASDGSSEQSAEMDVEEAAQQQAVVAIDER